MIKYLCKKEYAPSDLVPIRYGDVVGVIFNQRKPYICTIYRGRNETEISYKIPEEDLYEHFYLYDDIESIDTQNAIMLFSFKFKTMGLEKELRMLKDLRFYINAREKFIRSCKKEDIRQERNTTEERLGCNQN